jgi:hypothetical protein
VLSGIRNNIYGLGWKKILSGVMYRAGVVMNGVMNDIWCLGCDKWHSK